MSRASENPIAKRLNGVGLSPGLAIGTAYKVEPRTGVLYRIQILEDEVADELERLRQALQESHRQLELAKKKFESEVGEEHAYIIDAHMLILDDRQLIQEVEERVIGKLQSPEHAIREASENWLEAYRSLDDPFFQERGSDVEEVVERVVANLMQLDSNTSSSLPEDLILVASEVSLLLLADYPLDRVKGLVLNKAGRTSHGIIVARSYQIPVVSGITDVEKVIRTGDILIVDGSAGTVRVHPTKSEITIWQKKLEHEKETRSSDRRDHSPCLTSDGRQIFLYANAEVGSEVSAGLSFGAEGIGLFRSEYIYMKDKKAPTGERYQFEIYRRLANEVGERPAIIRTLDLGEEEHPYFSSLMGGTESVLGLRGIRFSLQYPAIFKNQIRALLRASVYGNLKIVIPMVSSVDEVSEVRRLIRETQADLSREGTKIDRQMEVGVMLEVPAAILMLEAISKEADFFAVGTNDLIQFTLAAGRTDDRIAHLSNPLHPAILKSLYQVARVAREGEIMVMVCGEIASNPLFASLLVGMGFQHLSMNPFSIPDIKNILRKTSYRQVKDIVEQVLRLPTIESVETCVAERFAELRRQAVSELTG